jgi:histone H3/H4
MESLHLRPSPEKSDSQYVEPSLRLPPKYFHALILQELSKTSAYYSITEKAESIIQYTTEHAIEQFARDFELTTEYTGSKAISAKDIELTLFVQGKMHLMDKVKVTLYFVTIY